MEGRWRLVRRVGTELCWDLPSLLTLPGQAWRSAWYPEGASPVRAEQSSPSRSGSQFTTLNPPGIAQTGCITPPSGLLEPVHIAASASVIRCCNCLWAPEKSLRAESLSSHLLSQLPSVMGTQHMLRDHGAARLAVVVVGRVLRNSGLADSQGP